MTKEKLAAVLAVGAGVAAATYLLLSDDIPDGALPVQNFEMEKYLGLWHEIARIPNRIEKNISRLTEEYTDNGDGTFKVITKGFNTAKDRWTRATGQLKFLDGTDIGMLKVSYLGPFYANYNILALDGGYQYALVSGSSVDYLWFLSRRDTMPDDVKRKFLLMAHDMGFDVGKLEWV